MRTAGASATDRRNNAAKVRRAFILPSNTTSLVRTISSQRTKGAYLDPLNFFKVQSLSWKKKLEPNRCTQNQFSPLKYGWPDACLGDDSTRRDRVRAGNSAAIWRSVLQRDRASPLTTAGDLLHQRMRFLARYSCKTKNILVPCFSLNTRPNYVQKPKWMAPEDVAKLADYLDVTDFQVRAWLHQFCT